ncbi:conserved hypothetical protein [Ferroglobus placidus DSM 10642]|uniref:Uncharacterized protein n=1 Tax=Ferroglobus placidus (strain DSM 10642 / AEDII12DO) TaxID=589924 RepID=D3S0L7_FERPA|nr:hypothetical protein [Ferroglobus placidus]ADC66258.1 conserved hypothetical protein [Ferroglobus placidus DSM 10642]
MMLDRKSRLMLILGLLNDCFGDLRSTVVNLSDFISSHPDFKEIDEFSLREILRNAQELERKIVEVMDEIKKELFTQ